MGPRNISLLMKNGNYLDITNDSLLGVDPSSFNQRLNNTYNTNAGQYIKYMEETFEITFDLFIKGTRSTVDTVARNMLNTTLMRVDYDGIYATKQIRPVDFEFSEKQYAAGTVVQLTLLSLSDWLIYNGNTIDLKNSGKAPTMVNGAKIYNYVYNEQVYYDALSSSSYTITNSVNHILFKGNNIETVSEDLNILANDISITLTIPAQSNFEMDSSGTLYINGVQSDLTAIMSNDDVYKFEQLFKYVGVQTTQFTINNVGSFDTLTATTLTKTPWL